MVLIAVVVAAAAAAAAFSLVPLSVRAIDLIDVEIQWKLGNKWE